MSEFTDEQISYLNEKLVKDSRLILPRKTLEMIAGIPGVTLGIEVPRVFTASVRERSSTIYYKGNYVAAIFFGKEHFRDGEDWMEYMNEREETYPYEAD